MAGPDTATIVAFIGAAGTVVSAYVAAKVRIVEKQTNSRLTQAEAKVDLLERELRGVKNKNLLT